MKRIESMDWTCMGSSVWVSLAALASSWLVACGNASGSGFEHRAGETASAEEPQYEQSGDARSGTAEALEMLADCGVEPMSGPVVVGYVPSWVGDFEGLLASLDLETLTHVNLAFTNPTGAAGQTVYENVDDHVLLDFVDTAHSFGVKVIASIGGINHSELIRNTIVDDEEAYIDDLERFLNEFNLDGVDVDIEGSYVDASYGPFVRHLSERLRPQGKEITSAVGGWFAEGVTDEALFCFDFVNEMAYDAAGGWTGPDEHAARDFTRNRARYWVSDRGYPAERVVIGVPFYGYCWGSDCARDGSQIRFESIVEAYPDSLQSDWIRPDGLDLQINYNSPATLTYKADLSRQYGGIMIWDMSQDSDDAILFQAVKAGL